MLNAESELHVDGRKTYQKAAEITEEELEHTVEPVRAIRDERDFLISVRNLSKQDNERLTLDEDLHG